MCVFSVWFYLIIVSVLFFLNIFIASAVYESPLGYNCLYDFKLCLLKRKTLLESVTKKKEYFLLRKFSPNTDKSWLPHLINQFEENAKELNKM